MKRWIKRHPILFILILGGAVYVLPGLLIKLTPEYKALRVSSEIASQEFFDNRNKAMASGIRSMPLKSLVTQEWQWACYVYEYSDARASLRSEHSLSKDYPILEGVPYFHEGEEGLIFVDEDKVVAVVRGEGLDIRYPTARCIDWNHAKLVSIPDDAHLTAQQRAKLGQKPELAALRQALGNCTNKESCDFIFTGE